MKQSEINEISRFFYNEDNRLENLRFLCPNCHKKITLHLYHLLDDFVLEPLE